MRTLIALAVAQALGLALLGSPQLQAGELDDSTKIRELKQQLQEITEELDILNSRVDKTERHTALDRLEISGDFR
ncbi:hypothetical protein MW386_004839, partial [Citrobacter freundii]|nr:hypothetical protein [Citrobacter freundii]